MNREDLLKKRFKELTTEIQKIKADDQGTCVVAVTKYSPVDDIFISHDLGHQDFGENRVLDLQEKAEEFADRGIDDVNWHFIGNLQSNKINRLLKIPNLKFIHSIDSLSLLQSIISKEDQFRGDRLGLFLQVNTSGESEKQGFDNYDTLAGAINFFLDEHGSRIYLAGLMTMGRIRSENVAADAKECFKTLKEYRKRLEDDFGVTDLKLSMGMSGDYRIALEQGSDYIRVGSVLYKSHSENE